MLESFLKVIEISLSKCCTNSEINDLIGLDYFCHNAMVTVSVIASESVLFDLFITELCRI